MQKEECLYKEVCTNECKDSCIRYLEIDYLLRSSNIPKSKQKIHTLYPENCDIKAFENLGAVKEDIVNFVKSGKSLYLYSTNCGNGKTTWSIKLMLQYFNEMWAGNGFTKRGIFIHVPTFLNHCKSTISTPDKDFFEMRDSLATVDLVVWDEIASTKLSEYDYNILLAFIDQRTINEKSNIYTGNILPNDLTKYVGAKLSSRIVNNSEVIKFMGGDRR